MATLSSQKPPRASRSASLQSIRSFTSQNSTPELLEGYYGHTTVKQEQALTDLKALLSKDGIAIASLEDEAKGVREHGVSDLELL